jgi:threonine dehydrogenase-like Zn-dependent dehydrogenase
MSHATHCVMDTNEPVIKVTEKIPPQEAAFARIAGIGMTAAQVTRIEPLMTAGVWGLGMIGNFCALSFVSAGARTIGIDPVAQRRDLANRCGISETLDPNDPNFAEKLAKVSDGEGLDVVIDSTGHAPTAITLPNHARLRGQMVFLTHWRKQEVPDPSPMIRDIFVKSLTVHGAHEYFVESELGGRARWVTVQNRKWKRILRDVANGGMKLAPMISHFVKPDQAKEAYDGLCFDKNNWWGVTVDWRG